MEYDRQRPYSVLTRDEVKEKTKKQIDEISEIFSISKSNATVLLMYLGWDSLQVSDCLVDNKEKVFSESGLKSVVVNPSRELSNNSCRICFKIVDEFYDDGDDYLISTPFCSHKFCTTCWRKYLYKNLYYVEKIQTTISCPRRACHAAVGPDTIQKLTIRDQEMYERYLLRSYLEGNKVLMIKQCPARDCNYVIEFHQENHDDDDEEEYSRNVVCLCGHIFCWRCMLESHRPVTCNNASDWLSRDLTNLSEVSDESWSLSSIKTSTNEPKTLERRAEVENSCVERWKVSQVSMEQAKSDLQAFEECNIKKPSDLNEKDITIIREGLMLIVQCRQFLKWSCVYDYLHTEYEASKREYLRVLQDQATALVQSYSTTLKEETERVLSANSEKFCCVRHKVSISTSNIGNYFYHFIKTLQDGLDEVKVKSYDDYGGLYWLCDRCTYGNTWFHKDKECKMCRDDIAAPVELSGLSDYGRCNRLRFFLNCFGGF